MLGNIKLLLGIATEDTTKDAVINYHIKVVTNNLLIYCSIPVLPIELEYIVVEIVVKRLEGDKVKRVKMGDYEKEYLTPNVSEDEFSPYKNILKTYTNKVRFF